VARGEGLLNYDPHLHPRGPAKRAANTPVTLAALAEDARGLLGCQAVVIRLEGRYAHVFAANAPQGSSGGRAPVCELACDGGSAMLPSPARADPTSLADPQAAGDLGFPFYAGLPLRLASGESLGTLAALDTAPRPLTGNQLATLRLLARVIVDMAEFRLAVAAAEENGQQPRG
jgi:GAF domain-containing protein